MNELTQDSFQAVFVALWPIIQNWMTSSSWSIFAWLKNSSSARLKIAVSGLGAVLSTAGFHLTWMWQGSAALGWHLLPDLTIPPAAALGHILAAWVVQHHLYNFAVKNPQLTQQLLNQVTRLVALQQEHLDAVKILKP